MRVPGSSASGEVRSGAAPPKKSARITGRLTVGVYSLGGHSGEGSVCASGFLPQEAANMAAMNALMPSAIFERKFRLVFIGSPFVGCRNSECPFPGVPSRVRGVVIIFYGII